MRQLVQGLFVFNIERKCKTRIKKNEDFHENGLPLLDAIAITFIKDKQTAFLEFSRVIGLYFWTRCFLQR